MCLIMTNTLAYWQVSSSHKHNSLLPKCLIVKNTLVYRTKGSQCWITLERKKYFMALNPEISFFRWLFFFLFYLGLANFVLANWSKKIIYPWHVTGYDEYAQKMGPRPNLGKVANLCLAELSRVEIRFWKFRLRTK